MTLDAIAEDHQAGACGALCPYCPMPTLAISVYAPWAWAMLYGGKTLENRTHGKRKFPMVYNGTPVLGDVWLHASLWPGGRGPLREGRQLDEFCDEIGRMLAIYCLASGRVDPSAAEWDVPQLKRMLAERFGAKNPTRPFLEDMRGHIVGRLRVTGYRDPDDPPDSPWYVPGSRAVLVENPRPLAVPVPAKGALGWWPVPADVLEQFRRSA